MNDNKVEELIAYLMNNRTDVQKQAAEALGEMRDPRAIEPLIGISLESMYLDCRIKAVEALVNMGSQAVTYLIEIMRRKYSPGRNRAAEILGKIGDPRAVEPLVEALGDEDIRYAAAEALSSIQDPKALHFLLQVVKGKDHDARDAAAMALINIGAPALEPMIKLLID